MEPSRPRVALLIDGDNSASISIPSVLAEAGKLGEVMIRRVYGNWSLSSMHAWQEVAQHYGLEQRHHGQTTPGKNATDIALVIDAMDILYSGAIEHFCLVASDSDYTPLALRLRSAGCQVLGIGKPTTPLALQTACTEFVATDQLLSREVQPFPTIHPGAALAEVRDTAVPAASLSRAEASMMSASSLFTEPLTLLMKAYEEVAGSQEVEWVLLSSIGTVLKQFNALFSPKVFGHKDLLTFVKAYPERFETRRQASKGKPILVRRRDPPAPEEPRLPPASVRATTSPAPRIRKKATPPSSPVPTEESMLREAQPLRDLALTALLIKACTQAAEKLHEQWVPTPQFGAALKRLDPECKAKAYGYKDLPTMVQSYADLFLTRKQTTGKTKHVEVRLV
ncbi:MAG: NYN domain-containing protein [Ktedonobacteraceae bacterium]